MNSNLQNDFQNAKVSVKNPKPEWWLSWPAIIIICIVFWPVGLFLIWKRTTIDKKAALFSGRAIGIFGWISLSFALLGFLVSISEGFESDDVTAILFFLLAGIGLVILGKKIKNNANKSKKYISIIVNDGVIDIDNIAAAIPTSYENAIKDLQKMIDKGFFEGAYINESVRQIVIPRKHQEPLYNQSNNADQSIRMQIVTCKGCGAHNSIATGTVGECEFCGSKIEVE
ncbi:hypothetical protein [Clostridium sp. DJ247]|uniref:hypothetical protein n=1 Tax=Clostridium sp. DJ247 TaxID=2726188 RepID=UPI0016276F29|nr:hypothetical protein [Clostridium sp. DJ247]MBC2579427.1 hypothetical protein [Clostridium sp. DJ247]